MVEIASGVCVHVLDPVPGVVVVGVTDGLRARGHHVELRGASLAAGAARVNATNVLEHCTGTRGVTDVYLTSRPLDSDGERPGELVHGVASRAHRSAIVSLPPHSEATRFRTEVADRVLELVLREIGHLQQSD